MKKDNSRLYFYLLFVYIVLQFVWWTYLIVDLNQEIALLQSKLNPDLEINNQRKIWMVIGEGSVFLLILFLGLNLVLKSYRKKQELMKQENNFLLSVTHELNSPLASIKLFLETIRKRSLDEVKMKKLLKSAETEVLRLENTLGNILQLNRVSSKTGALHREQQDLSAFLQKWVAEKCAFFSNEIEFESEIQAGIDFYFDPNAFKLILNNLFDNTLKYSSKPTKIQLKLFREIKNQKLMLQFSDFGKGILDKEKVLEKFYREENEMTRNSKGTGLGLYLVKNLVNLHNGDIYILDNQPKGSIIQLRFDQ